MLSVQKEFYDKIGAKKEVDTDRENDSDGLTFSEATEVDNKNGDDQQLVPESEDA